MVSTSQFEFRLIGCLRRRVTCLVYVLYCVPNSYDCKVGGARICGLWLCDYVLL